jgi:hypothetical protein
MAAPPSTIAVQAMGAHQMRFDVGRGALQVSAAVQAAPLWCADLRLVSSAMCAAVIAAVTVGAYTIASGGTHAWTPAVVQTPLFALAVLWWAAGVWPWRRVLAGTLYATMGALLGLAVLLAWWVLSRTHRMTPATWWSMTAALGFELLFTVGAAMAVGNLLDCRLICDGHSCMRAALVDRTAAQLHRGEPGNGGSEPRLAAGVLALHDASLSAAATQPGKKRA